MKTFCFIISLLFVYSQNSFCQNEPNLSNATPLSPTTEAASKLSSVTVNIFTGVPQIGVPLYSYSNTNNGLSLNVSLNYFAGGTQVAESPSAFGLGWYLNAGGTITRTVRGTADDMAYGTGYLYDSVIANDCRSNAEGYYNDYLDAEQDIFQYSFNGRSGKFIIGKNLQIVQMPLTKLKIIPTFGTSGSAIQTIIAFRVITEDGIKYDFNNIETTNITLTGTGNIVPDYYNNYNSSWSLTQIISAFNTDTIKFNYVVSTVATNFNFPQFTFVRNSDGFRTKTISQTGKNTSTTNLISSIVFPEKTKMTFQYSSSYNQSQIKISDSVFRYGYLLNFQDTISGSLYCRKLLKSVTPYTSKQKNSPYTFAYNTPLLAALGSAQDTIQNQRDYWGYYNGASNGTNLIPQVNGYTWGANRNSNITYALSNSLSNFNLPDGGSVFYEYELNDHLPYTKDPHSLTISPTTNTSTNVTLSQIFQTAHQLTFVLDSNVSRSGTTPITGTGNMIVNIKSTDGTITYKSDTLSLYDLFYHGIKTWVFTIPNGTYKLEQLAAAGTTITGSFPVYIRYENKLVDNSHTSIAAGGLRVKRITNKFSATGATAKVQEFQYINTDGTSSGFLGDIPRFDYPYLETINYGGVTTTSYTDVSSDPINTMSYAQGNPVGYSRVVVIDGTATHNIGKTVYNFTSLQDVNANFNTEVFPYAPQDLKDWGIGLPKTISVYDSVGTLIKKTANNYTFDSAFFINNNFKSLKLGNSFTYYNGNPAMPSSKAATYIGQEYYPVSGHPYLASSFDTLFQSNGSLNTNYVYYTYDSNYNVTKTVTSFDRNRGLQLERRFYYPYNYILSGAIKTLKDSSIITPVISEEDWITGDANPRILSGTITDYQQINGYIKPLALYHLQSNAPVPLSVIGAINGYTLNRSPTYFVKQSSFINYDSKGNLLQAQNAISGINNSVIMDYGQQYPIAKVSNAAIADIAYTSFESDGSGNWTIPSTLRDSLNAITGKKSYDIGNGNITKSGLNTGTTYLVSMWVSSSAHVSVNGSGLGTGLATQGAWILFNISVSGVTTVTVSGTGLIDELRLHPAFANMVTSAYEPNIGVTSITDANNTIVYNEYDNLNRIKIIRDKDKNILKRYDYSDTANIISLNPAWTFQSTNCEVAMNGTADSTFYDSNIYSDTYQQTRITTYTDICRCANPAHPDYKIVNGKCEQAQTCCTASVYTKVVNPDGSYSFEWKCTNHYKWSDGSVSADFVTYNSSSCYIGCVLPGQ